MGCLGITKTVEPGETVKVFKSLLFGIAYRDSTYTIRLVAIHTVSREEWWFAIFPYWKVFTKFSLIPKSRSTKRLLIASVRSRWRDSIAVIFWDAKLTGNEADVWTERLAQLFSDRVEVLNRPMPIYGIDDRSDLEQSADEIHRALIWLRKMCSKLFYPNHQSYFQSIDARSTVACKFSVFIFRIQCSF